MQLFLGFFRKKGLLFFLIGVFVFRLFYGLSSEFWFEDELQIYLIGLKSFTQHLWPYYGPDVVYTNTQIPGAAQGLLVSLPFYLLPIPESPTLFLNILSFFSLLFFARYILFRIKGMPAWLVYLLVLASPMTLFFSTRVVNPSYVVTFSFLFFVAWFESLEFYKERWLKPWVSYLILGVTATLIMQLHLSWVLLFPLLGFSFFRLFTLHRGSFLRLTAIWVAGALIGLITLFPTLLNPDVHAGNVSSNIVFNLSNFGKIFTVFSRYVLLAGFDINYLLGGSTEARLAVLKEFWFLIPIAPYLLILGFAQVLLFIAVYFMIKDGNDWKWVKRINLFVFLMVWVSFFFSIKGPSTHAFVIVMPLPVFYSIYVYRWFISRWKWGFTFIKITVVAMVIFSFGLSLYNLKHKSLYTDREKVVKAIEEKDYHVLGERRSDVWGYGF